jgi:enterochelin esterase family protein
MMMIRLAIALLLCGAVSLAQAPDTGRPAPSNVQGAAYPRINADGTVTFRIRADNAHTVAVNLPDFGNVPLTKGEGGFWLGTTAAPVPPGFYYYTVNVDGFTSNDLGSQTFYGYSRYGSGLEVPGPDSALWSPRDVPHGVVREQYYFSKTMQAWRRIRVYTPPDYDTNRTARYPVLYLQHGAGENETSWTHQGHAGFILDNLLADKRIRPMIVVNENGVVPSATPGRAAGPAPAPPAAPAPASPPAAGAAAGPAAVPPTPPGAALPPGRAGGRGATAPANTFAEFDAIVSRDLVPFIDASYRTLAHRDSRAIAGLSMGGGQAMRIGLGHLDLFSAIGLFSPALRNLDPATAYEGRLKDAAAINRQLRLLWIGIGTTDFLYESVKVSHENLTRAGITHQWVETAGGHVWPVWRKYLAEFAPLLFK